MFNMKYYKIKNGKYHILRKESLSPNKYLCGIYHIRQDEEISIMPYIPDDICKNCKRKLYSMFASTDIKKILPEEILPEDLFEV